VRAGRGSFGQYCCVDLDSRRRYTLRQTGMLMLIKDTANPAKIILVPQICELQNELRLCVDSDSASMVDQEDRDSSATTSSVRGRSEEQEK